MPTMEYVDAKTEIFFTLHRINYYDWKLINMDIEKYAIISTLVFLLR